MSDKNKTSPIAMPNNKATNGSTKPGNDRKAEAGKKNENKEVPDVAKTTAKAGLDKKAPHSTK